MHHTLKMMNNEKGVDMPSPFPGMDPYLEGYLWPDVHHRLASEIARQLGKMVRLDLSHILQTIYNEAGYDLSLDYTQAPPSPSVSPEISLWMQKLLSPSDA